MNILSGGDTVAAVLQDIHSYESENTLLQL